MPPKSLWFAIKKIKRPVFTTSELAALSGKSASSVSQSLDRMAAQNLVERIHRGVWLEKDNEQISPYSILSVLFPKVRIYVSFLSALRLHGIIGQIPNNITVAATTHSKTIRTKYWTYVVHQLDPSFFRGFDWYKGDGSFLIARPEKALADCLYLATRKNRRYAHFPEMDFPKTFRFAQVKNWIQCVADPRIRSAMSQKLDEIKRTYRSD